MNKIGRVTLKKLLIILLLIPMLLLGCNKENTIEESFHSGMSNLEEIQSYSIIELDERNSDGFVIHTRTTEEQYKMVRLAYFKKENNEWKWIDTVNCEDLWTKGGHGESSYYCGVITEPKYNAVFVGEKEANLINLNETKRVWYYLSDNLDDKIQGKLLDGTYVWFKK
jgi:hypothetical protein